MVSLPPMTVVSLAPTLDVVGARMGQTFLLFGCGILIGQPVAGLILSSTGRYLGTQAFCAAAVTVCTCGLLMARIVKAGAKVMVKA